MITWSCAGHKEVYNRNSNDSGCYRMPLWAIRYCHTFKRLNMITITQGYNLEILFLYDPTAASQFTMKANECHYS